MELAELRLRGVHFGAVDPCPPLVLSNRPKHYAMLALVHPSAGLFTITQQGLGHFLPGGPLTTPGCRVRVEAARYLRIACGPSADPVVAFVNSVVAKVNADSVLFGRVQLRDTMHFSAESTLPVVAMVKEAWQQMCARAPGVHPRTAPTQPQPYRHAQSSA